MNLSVYLLQEDRYILVPDCFLPSMECQQRHGLLAYGGQVSVEDSRCDANWRALVETIEAKAYAVLDAKQALLLFGAGHRVLQSSNQSRNRGWAQRPLPEKWRPASDERKQARLNQQSGSRSGSDAGEEGAATETASINRLSDPAGVSIRERQFEDLR